MHKTSKSKRTVKVSWDLTIECPASLSLTCGKDCGKCRKGDGCPLRIVSGKAPLPEKGSAAVRHYSRGVSDPVSGRKELAVTSVCGHLTGDALLSNITGLFAPRRWYPTYFILLCVRLAVEEGISPRRISSMFNGTPSASTIYRWISEWRAFLEDPGCAACAGLFGPVQETMELLCPGKEEPSRPDGGGTEGDGQEAPASPSSAYMRHIGALRPFCPMVSATVSFNSKSDRLVFRVSS